MAQRVDSPIEPGNQTALTNEQSSPRLRWWHHLLPWRSHNRTPEIEHPGPWSLEEDRTLRHYHAGNLAAARRATEDLVREGWHTGPIPYGYRAQRIRISPTGRRPRYRTRLLIEPVEASVVKMIFLWRVHDGLSIDEIVHRLNDARYPAPIRLGVADPVGWASAGVQAILGNPKYTGYQVWGRTHHGYPTPSEQWIWSSPWAHPPVIDLETFVAAQRISSRPPSSPARDGLRGRAA